MKKYDVFLVDADNTLLDFHKSAMLAIRDTFEHFGVECKEEYLKKYEIFNESLWQKLERKELTREELMNNRFSWFFQEIGLTRSAFKQAHFRITELHKLTLELV